MTIKIAGLFISIIGAIIIGLNVKSPWGVVGVFFLIIGTILYLP